MATTFVPASDGDSYWVSDLEFATYKLTGDDTNQAFGLVELIALPGAEPPPHVHRETAETYNILEGTMTFLLGGEVFTASKGAVVYIPIGALHAWRNASDKPVRAHVLFTPSGFENVIAEVGKPGGFAERPAATIPTSEDEARMLELGDKYATEYPPTERW